MEGLRWVKRDNKLFVWLEGGVREMRDEGRDSPFGPTNLNPLTNGRVQQILPNKSKKTI